MTLFPVRVLINSFVKRPCAHFRSFTNSPYLANKPPVTGKYKRPLTKREANLYKQFIQRHMAAPVDDNNVEALLEPFRVAVKMQVSDA